MTLTVLELVALGGVTFLVGVVVGLMLSEAFAIARTGHTRTMPLISRAAAHVSPRAFGIGLVGLAMASNALVGFLQIENGRDDRDRVACQTRFNAQQQAALDERSARGAASTGAEIALWTNLLDVFARPDSSIDEIAAEIRAYLVELRKTQRSRVENPYPAADLCKVEP